MQQLHQSLATVQGNDSPGAKSVLEVLDGAQAAQAAGCHDANPRTQRLTLLHAMRCQNDCVTCNHSMSATSASCNVTNAMRRQNDCVTCTYRIPHISIHCIGAACMTVYTKYISWYLLYTVMQAASVQWCN